MKLGTGILCTAIGSIYNLAQDHEWLPKEDGMLWDIQNMCVMRHPLWPLRLGHSSYWSRIIIMGSILRSDIEIRANSVEFGCEVPWLQVVLIWASS